MTTTERVIALAAGLLETPGHAISRNDSLIDDLGADSLDVTELLMEAEEEFGLPERALDGREDECVRISDLVRLVDEALVSA